MRYEVRAALAMGALVLLAIAGFVGLQKAMAPPLRAFPLGRSADSFAVRNPELIRPTEAAYARFASEDAEWRAQYASPPEEPAADRPWTPSPRQALNDRVYRLSQAGRLDQAIELLTAWVERNPGDREQLLKLARLLNQAGRSEEAIPRYRQVLALAEGQTK